MSAATLTAVADLRDLDREAWRRFVEAHPAGMVFQSPAMADFFEAVPRYASRGAAVVDTVTREILGLVAGVEQREGRGIVGWATARTVVWGGPLVAPGGRREAVLDLLLDTFSRRSARASIYVEFRPVQSLADDRATLERRGFAYEDHLNILVPTTDRAATTKAVSTSRMRQVRKSLKTGAEVGIATTLEEVQAFYAILQALYRTTVKKPLPAWDFFREFFERRTTPDRIGLGHYFIVRFEGRVVGGIMCPVSAGRAIHEWYIAGLDREIADVNPSVLATWAPIDHALDHGIPMFDFMGAGKPDQDYGVREFKEKFGGQVVSFGRFTRINRPLQFRMGQLGLRLLQKIR